VGGGGKTFWDTLYNELTKYDWSWAVLWTIYKKIYNPLVWYTVKFLWVLKCSWLWFKNSLWKKCAWHGSAKVHYFMQIMHLFNPLSTKPSIINRLLWKKFGRASFVIPAPSDHRALATDPFFITSESRLESHAQ
jgi:hypothetical protein